MLSKRALFLVVALDSMNTDTPALDFVFQKKQQKE